MDGGGDQEGEDAASEELRRFHDGVFWKVFGRG